VKPTPASTPKPTPKSTPRPTPRPTARPTPKPTPTPTPKPTPTPTARPVVISLEAKDTAFAPASLSVPAGRAFAIKFSNADLANTHNVTVASKTGALVFNGKIIVGVASVTYAVPALAAGTYRIGCIVHPAMSATLTVR
jgi:plastocyanin